jgi:hypothetical protein
MVLVSFVGIIFFGVLIHYYDEGSGRFRTSVARDQRASLISQEKPSPRHHGENHREKNLERTRSGAHMTCNRSAKITRQGNRSENGARNQLPGSEA